MAVIGSVDPEAKRIYLGVGVRAYHPVDDLYRELRALRRTDETLRPYDVPLVASGNVAKGGGKFTPRLVTFRNGWKVVPEDVSHTLNVTGEQITDEGESGPAAIDFAPLSASSKVVVNYEPPAAEIIEREVGSGVTEQDKDDIADRVLDEAASGHTTAGTIGAYLSSIYDRVGKGLKRGEAVSRFHIVMLDATDHVTPKSGLAVSVQLAKDADAFSALADSVDEIGNGVYHFSLSATEMDAKVITLRCTAPGADPRVVTIITAE